MRYLTRQVFFWRVIGTGASQYGDQRMRDANLALLRHVQDGRLVHLFAGAGGEVEYMAELAIDRGEPFYETEAPETGPLRKVFVFKLRPIRGEPRGPKSRLAEALKEPVEEVDVERELLGRDRAIESRDQPSEAASQVLRGVSDLWREP